MTPQILGQSEDIALDSSSPKATSWAAIPRAARVPITSTHHVETKIYVKSTESAAIAGINSQDIGTDFNKDDPQPGTFTQRDGPVCSRCFTRRIIVRRNLSTWFSSRLRLSRTPRKARKISKKNFRVKVK